MEFGVFGFEDKEMRFAFITEDTPAARQPRHLYPVAFLQVVYMDAFALKSVTLNVRARAFNRFARARLMTVLSGVYRRRF